MSETKQNQQKVVLVPLKSAMVGFLLAFIGLGWFGIDRFYKGDTMLGLFKLFCPILALIAWGSWLSNRRTCDNRYRVLFLVFGLDTCAAWHILGQC